MFVRPSKPNHFESNCNPNSDQNELAHIRLYRARKFFGRMIPQLFGLDRFLAPSSPGKAGAAKQSDSSNRTCGSNEASRNHVWVLDLIQRLK